MAWIPASHPGFGGRSEWKGWGPLALATKSGLGVPEPRVLPRQHGTPKTSNGGRQRAPPSIGDGTEPACRQPLNQSPRFPVRASPGNSTPPGGRGPQSAPTRPFLVLPSRGTVDIFHKVGGRARKVEGFDEGAVHTAALGRWRGDLQSPPKRLVALLAPPCGSSLRRTAVARVLPQGGRFCVAPPSIPSAPSPLRREIGGGEVCVCVWGGWSTEPSPLRARRSQECRRGPGGRWLPRARLGPRWGPGGRCQESRWPAVQTPRPVFPGRRFPACGGEWAESWLPLRPRRQAHEWGSFMTLNRGSPRSCSHTPVPGDLGTQTGGA